MFPGQGSQSVGMGKDFYESSAKAKLRFDEADEALSSIGFESKLSEICFEGPVEKLTETAITQPAILVTSVIAFEAYRDKVGAESIANNIVGGAGHSLGEFSALVAAGSIAFQDAVKLVHHRGIFMQRAVPVGKGKMAAVLGKESEEIAKQISELALPSVELANMNAPGQIVIAGLAEEIDSFIAKSEGWKIKELQVSAPFHSALMNPAAEELAPLLNELKIEAPNFPIYQNVNGKTTTDPEEIRTRLLQQVSGTVRWVECMQNLIGATSPTVAYEFGPGKVLSGLLRRIEKGLPSKTIGTIEEIATIE